MAFITPAALVLLDTQSSVARGWSPRELGALVVVPAGALAVLIGVLLVSLVPQVRTALARRAAGWWLALLGLLVGLGLSEGLARFICPPPAFHRRPANTVYEFTPDGAALPGMGPRGRTTINAQGLRGAELPATSDAARVLCLGGSTTECYWLDDADAWPAVLAARLDELAPNRSRVGAAAVSELATGHHARFVADDPLIEQSDIVLVMPGANDIVRLLLGLDQGQAKAPWWTRLRLVSLAKEYWNGVRRNGYFVDATGQHLERILRLGRDIPEPEGGIDLEAALNAYGQRLRALVQAAKKRGVRVVLVTQPVQWSDGLGPQELKRLVWARTWPEPRAWSLLTPAQLRAVADRFNAELLSVALAEGAPAIDAAATLNGQELAFYDDFHLNRWGCAALGRLLADELLAAGALDWHRRATE